MIDDVTFAPPGAWWRDLKAPACGTVKRSPPAGGRSRPCLLGHDLDTWRTKTRRELGLAVDKPIVGTGHQSLLWHPGILAKYLLVQAVSDVSDVAVANLVVDQHAGGFGRFDAPLRRRDGGLAVRTLHLARERADVPMALHEAFIPPTPPGGVTYATPSAGLGVEHIYTAVDAHRDAANAALQMAAALGDLMRQWVSPMPHVSASDLGEGSLARALLTEMADDPWRCAGAYNDAVASILEREGHGIGLRPLMVRDDYVELPLWRIRDDGRRMRAYDNDVTSGVRLMPRALFLTALVRLGMCDCFVHGTGGARYDQAMEDWIRRWLDVDVAPAAVATATLRLDLAPQERIDPDQARQAARHAWHSPGPEKRPLLEAIDAAPRGSVARRAAFYRMHRELEKLRETHGKKVAAAQERATLAARQAADAPIANRRTWPFALYPHREIDALAAKVRAHVSMSADSGLVRGE